MMNRIVKLIFYAVIGLGVAYVLVHFEAPHYDPFLH